MGVFNSRQQQRPIVYQFDNLPPDNPIPDIRLPKEEYDRIRQGWNEISVQQCDWKLWLAAFFFPIGIIYFCIYESERTQRLQAYRETVNREILVPRGMEIRMNQRRGSGDALWEFISFPMDVAVTPLVIAPVIAPVMAPMMVHPGVEMMPVGGRGARPASVGVPVAGPPVVDEGAEPRLIQCVHCRQVFTIDPSTPAYGHVICPTCKTTNAAPPH